MAEESQGDIAAPTTKQQHTWMNYLRKLTSISEEMDGARVEDNLPSPKMLRILRKIFCLETFRVVVDRTWTGPRVQFKKSVPATVCNILVTAVVAGVWIPDMRGPLPGPGQCDMLIKLTVIFVNVGMITGLVTLITSRTNSWSLQEILRLCVEVDAKLLDNTSELYKKSSRRFTLVVTPVLIYMLVAMCLSVWNFSLHSHLSSLSLNLTFNLVQFIIVTMTTHCVYCVAQIRQRLRLINVKFRHLDFLHEESAIHDQTTTNMSATTTECSSESCINIHVSQLLPESAVDLHDSPKLNFPERSKTEENIFQLREIYKKVCKMVPLLNDIFGLPILFFVLCVFASIDHIVYNIVIFMHPPYFEKLNSIPILIALLMWTSMYLIQALAIVWSCKATSYEVKETRDVIKTLLLQPRVAEGVVQQLKLFQVQIYGEEFSLTSGGMFALKEPLLGAVAVSVIAYLLALLQMVFENPGELFNTPTK